jgi:hypothetical protein
LTEPEPQAKGPTTLAADHSSTVAEGPRIHRSKLKKKAMNFLEWSKIGSQASFHNCKKYNRNETKKLLRSEMETIHQVNEKTSKLLRGWIQDQKSFKIRKKYAVEKSVKQKRENIQQFSTILPKALRYHACREAGVGWPTPACPQPCQFKKKMIKTLKNTTGVVK